jgi:hypothetical protein
MTISLEIPKEFEEHFNMDRFKDSLERVRVDIQCNIENDKIIISGLYELEVIKMLKNALIKSEVIER